MSILSVRVNHSLNSIFFLDKFFSAIPITLSHLHNGAEQSDVCGDMGLPISLPQSPQMRCAYYVPGTVLGIQMRPKDKIWIVFQEFIAKPLASSWVLSLSSFFCLQIGEMLASFEQP